MENPILLECQELSKVLQKPKEHLFKSKWLNLGKNKGTPWYFTCVIIVLLFQSPQSHDTQKKKNLETTEAIFFKPA